MADEILLQLGVGGIFAMLIIREFSTFISRWKGKNALPEGMESKIYEIIAQITTHMKNQSEGIINIAHELREINQTLGRMSSDYHFIREKMESVDSLLNESLERRTHRRGNGN